MVSEHEFNSRWRGKRAGIVRDLSFFSLPDKRRREMLDGFDWVEVHVPMEPGLPIEEIRRTGFYYVDIQVTFRVGLRRERSGGYVELEFRWGDDPGFELREREWCPFAHERYQFLPGTSQECIDRRYALWAADLVAKHPSCCVEVLANGDPQGWWLTQPDGDSGLNLTLGVLHRNAKIPAILFYVASFAEYGRRGYRSGRASFSILHTAVHNIYAQLGARFETPVGIWFWVPEETVHTHVR
jgi:hypothetical protein